eukprot:356443-Chlamydomonas_euryale.AAC.7
MHTRVTTTGACSPPLPQNAGHMQQLRMTVCDPLVNHYRYAPDVAPPQKTRFIRDCFYTHHTRLYPTTLATSTASACSAFCETASPLSCMLATPAIQAKAAPVQPTSPSRLIYPHPSLSCAQES